MVGSSREAILVAIDQMTMDQADFTIIQFVHSTVLSRRDAIVLLSHHRIDEVVGQYGTIIVVGIWQRRVNEQVTRLVGISHTHQRHISIGNRCEEDTISIERLAIGLILIAGEVDSGHARICLVLAIGRLGGQHSKRVEVEQAHLLAAEVSRRAEDAVRRIIVSQRVAIAVLHEVRRQGLRLGGAIELVAIGERLSEE